MPRQPVLTIAALASLAAVAPLPTCENAPRSANPRLK